MNQDSNPIEDDRLLQRWRSGDPAAGNALVERHQRGLLGYLLAMCGQRALAEDLLQETFLRALGPQVRYEERGEFRGFLFQVARNLLVDQARWNKRQPTAGPEALLELPGVEDPEQSHFEALRSERLRLALEELPPEQREVVLLHHYAGLAFREIAQIQGCPLGTCLGRMHYALRRLQTLIPRKEWSHDGL